MVVRVLMCAKGACDIAAPVGLGLGFVVRCGSSLEGWWAISLFWTSFR
jgi:hypothetical protein